MSKLDLNKLTRLGYQFWLPKRSENRSTKENLVFYVLNDKTLITGRKDEFKSYPRILPSIKKILGQADKEIKEIDQTETVSKEFNLVIDFSQGLSYKATKTLKFDSLKLLIKDSALKERFYSELKGSIDL
ncbi:uncharacterized protein METZ01_LOCUS3251 [marine metagenome]|uniref:Uncharacterized protein n=1 Tax=marine metagenome TaxID=408172 RepID=A0A381N7D5_9ZZZZ|tara:strand:- start:578 stop:967 length:390 start_codon:yes stop_codon:yes gene_type:complete